MKFILDQYGAAINTAFIISIKAVDSIREQATFVEAITYCGAEENAYTLKTFDWLDGKRLAPWKAAQSYIARLVNKINAKAKS